MSILRRSQWRAMLPCAACGGKGGVPAQEFGCMERCHSCEGTGNEWTDAYGLVAGDRRFLGESETFQQAQVRLEALARDAQAQQSGPDEEARLIAIGLQLGLLLGAEVVAGLLANTPRRRMPMPTELPAAVPEDGVAEYAEVI